MKYNWINIFFATAIAALLAWWLWTLGIEPVQKWLLACLGGAMVEIGLLGTMGVTYNKRRSGIQVKLVFSFLTFSTLVASFIYSFFRFSPEAYCIPVGVFGLICIYIGIKVYKTKE